MAAAVSVPNSFTNGANTDAPAMNANFAALVSWINTNAVHLDASKAFVAIPSGPAADPTTANQLTRKAYVDTLIPTGTISMFGGAAAPTGWLLCQGQEVSKATYAALFAVIGSSFGVAADPVNNFVLPDLQGKFAVGLLAADPNFGTLGATGGSKTFTLVAANLPTHTHAIDHNHAAFNTATEPAHTHGGSGSANFIYSPGSASGFFVEITNSATSFDVNYGSAALTGSGGAHDHSIDVPAFTGLSGTGTGLTATAKEHISPFQVVNYMIRT